MSRSAIRRKARGGDENQTVEGAITLIFIAGRKDQVRWLLATADDAFDPFQKAGFTPKTTAGSVGTVKVTTHARAAGSRRELLSSVIDVDVRLNRGGVPATTAGETT